MAYAGLSAREAGCYQGKFLLGANSAPSPLGEPPAPNGGSGDIEVLDGGLLSTKDSSSNNDYFYVGDGSSLRIRDGSVRIATTGSYRGKPFLFTPESSFIVDLTPGTLDYIDEKARFYGRAR